MTEITDRYFNDVIARLSGLRDRLAAQMEKAADLIAAAARADRRVYVFGTGHSHMMAEELHYRAGGLAITVPILCGSIMLQDGAVASSHFERIEGAVRPILDRYGIRDGDVLVVVSNSGVNAAPIEAARYAREKARRLLPLPPLPIPIRLPEDARSFFHLPMWCWTMTRLLAMPCWRLPGARSRWGRFPRRLASRSSMPSSPMWRRGWWARGRAHLSQRQYAGIRRYQPFAGGALPRPQSASLKNLGDLSSDRA